MDKNVIVSVKGLRSDACEEAGCIELVTEGKYYKRNGIYFLSYNESPITGMEGTTTVLEFQEGKVTLMRFGTTSSQLVFERGQKHVSYYDTAYGVFTVGVFANEVDVRLNDSGGDVNVAYSLEVDNKAASTNDFYMHIREA